MSKLTFSGASNDPPKYKIPEKNPVCHLEYASSPTYQKIGVFGMLEVRKLCYTTSIIIICNLIPQRPVLSVRIAILKQKEAGKW